MGKHIEVEDDIGMIDSAAIEVQDASDLRAIAVLVDRMAEEEIELRRLVAVARGHGKSWGQIGAVLGVSKQSAHERFAS